MKKRFYGKNVIGALMASVMCFTSFSGTVSAYSDTGKAELSGSGYYVQSNVWQSCTAFYKTHSFKVSAKCYTSSKCQTLTKASRIKTSYAFSPTGIGVSCEGVSSGYIAGKGFSGTWENTNANISDMSGTFKIKGAPLYSTFTNSAFAIKDGAKATAVAEVFRVY